MANCIYQYSVVGALMSGICQDGTTAQNILKHGDHGIGTVRGLNGELVIIDGAAYHFPANGPLHVVHATDIIPFAMVTKFQPTLNSHVPQTSMAYLFHSLSPLLPDEQNVFLSLRLRATFSRVVFRVIPAQSKPRETLLDLAKRQEIRECNHIQGTMFGFWSPRYTSGFSVPGFHLHLLSADRTVGGHVIDFEAEDGELGAAVVRNYQVEFPASDEFREVPLDCVTEKDLHTAEGASVTE
ncbi:acetolactate decarboxylase [Aspergillus lucknowensis]|uniref:Alpha-acetolactate decarboxylase n=1 Tax=Aspergillus lucknowensis TaxID=176173 RepID=A0ABR4LYN0_9EURO